MRAELVQARAAAAGKLHQLSGLIPLRQPGMFSFQRYIMDKHCVGDF